MADITIHNQGSVIGFYAASETGKQWLDENTTAEGWQWLGRTLYVDHRLAGELAQGILEAGLDVS